jgi:hypothetical protein
LKAERLRQLAASYRMDLKSPSTAAMLDDAADTLSRTSHPVQVEAAPSDTDREAVARLIDPYAFGPTAVSVLGPVRNAELTEFQDRLRGAAFEKADAILSLLSRTSHPVQVEVAPSDVDGVLAMLDGLNASGGIAYDDYSRLHDAVALLAPDEPVRVEVTDDRTKCELDAEGWMVAKPHDPCPIKVRTRAGNWVTTLPMSALGYHMPHEVQEFAPGPEFCQRPNHYFTALSAVLGGGK